MNPAAHLRSRLAARCRTRRMLQDYRVLSALREIGSGGAWDVRRAAMLRSAVVHRALDRLVARMTVEERMQLPPSDRAPLPMEALDPEFVAGLERWGQEFVEKQEGWRTEGAES